MRSTTVVSAALILVLGNLALAFELKECPEGKGTDAEIISFNIDTCPDHDEKRCSLFAGKNVTLDVEFNSKVAFDQAALKIGAVIANAVFPILQPSNACGNFGIDCPSAVGQKQTLHLSYPIDKSIPPMKRNIRIELEDDKSERVMCFQLPVEIKKA